MGVPWVDTNSEISGAAAADSTESGSVPAWGSESPPAGLREAEMTARKRRAGLSRIQAKASNVPINVKTKT